MRHLSLLPIVSLILITPVAAEGDTYFRMQMPFQIFLSGEQVEDQDPVLPLEVTPGEISLRGRVGAAMSAPLAGAGGLAPYEWTVGVAAPEWLGVANGLVSGTPLAAGVWSTSVVMDDASPETAAVNADLDIDVRNDLTVSKKLIDQYVQTGEAKLIGVAPSNLAGAVAWSFVGNLPASRYTMAKAGNNGQLTLAANMPEGEYAGHFNAIDDWDNDSDASNDFKIVVGDLATSTFPSTTTHSTLSKTWRMGNGNPVQATLTSSQPMIYTWVKPVRLTTCRIGRQVTPPSTVSMRIDLMDESGQWRLGNPISYPSDSTWIIQQVGCGNPFVIGDYRGPGAKVRAMRLTVLSGTLRLTELRAGFGFTFADYN